VSDRAKAYWALGGIYLFWGTTYIAIRLGVADTPPFAFASARFFIAGILLFLHAKRMGQALPKGREWLDLAIISLLMLGIGNGLLSWSEQWVPAGLASLIAATIPFWMAGFARIEGERTGKRAVAGLLVGLGGLLFALWPDLDFTTSGRGFLGGTIALAVACFCWAYGSVYARHHQPRSGPYMTNALEILFAAVVLAVVSGVNGDWARFSPSPGSWLAIVYLALFGSIVGFSAYQYCLEHLPVPIVSTYAYVNPLVAVALGVGFLGERLDPHMLVGTPLVLLGVYLVNSDKKAGEPVSSDRTQPEPA